MHIAETSLNFRSIYNLVPHVLVRALSPLALRSQVLTFSYSPRRGGRSSCSLFFSALPPRPRGSASHFGFPVWFRLVRFVKRMPMVRCPEQRRSGRKRLNVAALTGAARLRDGPRVWLRVPARSFRLGAEHGDRFDLDQQLRPAENRLDSRGSGQRVQVLLLVKRRALFVEGCVIALDIPQIAGGADDVLPGGALGGQQARDVLERAARLSPEIPDVNALAVFVDAGGAGNDRMAKPFKSMRNPREKELGLG